VNVQEVGRSLGVRYVLEGSVRKSNNRVRITGQLIDATTGGHLWAERFDRSLDDVFAVQDEVTARIVEALIGRLTVPPVRSRPANIEAYDLCVRGRALIASAGLMNCLPMGVFTSVLNVTGLPAISLPVHEAASGLPVGVQVIAPPWREDLLLQVGSQLEASLPWKDRHPALSA